jgi:hypothetical protein
MADGTGKVAYNSDLKRKAWMSEGLIQKSATSWWAPYKGSGGKSLDSAIIMVENDISKKSGHDVVYDFDGNLSGKPVKGNKTAKGTGEQKKKFSTKLTVSDYRYVVDNGTKFDGIAIGDLSINEHRDSREKLSDLWVRSEDQAYFDLAQQGAEFGIDLGTSATFDDLLAVEEVIKNGYGFTTSPAGISKRLPMKPFKLANGEPVWLWLADVSFKRKLLASAGMQAILQNADVRGNNNRLIKGVLGKVGSILFIEADTFFGSTEGSILTNGYYEYENTGVEIPGLRKYDSINEVWSGEEGFDITSTLKSRSVILGAGAFQKANGLMPDYKYEATDFEKFSESCLETWCAAKSTKLLAENKDNDDGKLAGYNWGSMFVDITVQTA